MKWDKVERWEDCCDRTIGSNEIPSRSKIDICRLKEIELLRKEVSRLRRLVTIKDKAITELREKSGKKEEPGVYRAKHDPLMKNI